MAKFQLCQFKKKHVKKKKETAAEKKVAQVMHEFKAGELHSGKTETIVTNPKQAIAIALHEAEKVKKTKK
jgi:Family of unknown function (DUF6496)